MKKADVSKDQLTEAITILTQAYNSFDPRQIERAISLLRRTLQKPVNIAAVRSDLVRNVQRGDFLPTGVEWLDPWLCGGLRKGEVVLIGAVPHAGKTHLLTWFGGQYILQGQRVLSLHGEDLIEDVKEYYSRAIRNKQAMKNLWLCDMQDKRFGVEETEAVIEGLAEEGNKPDIVVLDHMDLMRTSAGKADWEGIAEASLDLKFLAKRQKVVLITASQANFGSEQRGMAKLYRSKVGKGANCDVLLMVEDVIESIYDVKLWKARGRRVKEEDRMKRLVCDWDEMSIEEE